MSSLCESSDVCTRKEHTSGQMAPQPLLTQELQGMARSQRNLSLDKRNQIIHKTRNGLVPSTFGAAETSRAFSSFFLGAVVSVLKI